MRVRSLDMRSKGHKIVTTSTPKQTVHHCTSEFNKTIIRQKIVSGTAKKTIKSSEKEIEKMKARKRIEEIQLAKLLGINATDFI